MDLRDPSIALPSMDPLIAHLSIDRATIDRSRNHRSISRTTALARSMEEFVHVLWCEPVLRFLKKSVTLFSRIDMDPTFKTRMTAIATSKAASAKSCVLSQEKFDAIVRHLSSPQDKVDLPFQALG